jgi:acid phosphatase class B
VIKSRKYFTYYPGQQIENEKTGAQKTMIYTDHAKQRMQQRGIPELAVELINLYGRTEHSEGGRIRYLDQRARKKVQKVVLALANNIEKLEAMYYVEGEESVVVTAGHRTQPIKQGFKAKDRRAKSCRKRDR